jgi:hypothetical protein
MESNEADRRDESDPNERAEPEQPPVDGPSSGSAADEDDKDLGGSSYGQPGRS